METHQKFTQSENDPVKLTFEPNRFFEDGYFNDCLKVN